MGLPGGQRKGGPLAVESVAVAGCRAPGPLPGSSQRVMATAIAIVGLCPTYARVDLLEAADGSPLLLEAGGSRPLPFPGPLPFGCRLTGAQSALELR